MSNVKVQSSNEIQSSNTTFFGKEEYQMSKFTRSDEPKVNQVQMKSKAQTPKLSEIEI